MSFQGFHKPRYTQIPNEIFDLFLTELEHAEFKVLMYICRRTLGYHRDSVTISFDDLCESCGLSKKATSESVHSLISRNMIEKITPENPGRGQKSEYWIKFADEERVSSGDPLDEKGSTKGSPIQRPFSEDILYADHIKESKEIYNPPTPLRGMRSRQKPRTPRKKGLMFTVGAEVASLPPADQQVPLESGDNTPDVVKPPPEPRSGQSVDSLLLRWNDRVPSSPAESLGRKKGFRPECLGDPVFIEKFDQICDAAQQVHERIGEKASWLTFDWIMKYPKNEAVSNWAKILSPNFRATLYSIGRKREEQQPPEENYPKKWL